MGANAARLPGQVGNSMHPGHNAVAHSTDGLVQILGRRWGIIVAVTIVSVIAGLAYLGVTRKVYTSTAELRVDPFDPQQLATSNVNHGDTEGSADFLQTQCVEIKSSAVMTLALEKVRATKTLAGVSRPLDYLKLKLTAEPAKQGQVIDLSFEGPQPEEAVKILAAVIDSYREFEENSHLNRIKTVVKLIEDAAKERTDKITREQADQADIAKTLGFTPKTDPAQNEDQKLVDALSKDKISAESAVNDAKAAHDKAAQAIYGKPDLIKQYEERQDDKGTASVDPEKNLAFLQGQLQLWENTLENDTRSGYGAGHPTIKTDAAHVEQLTVDVVVAAKQWVDSAETYLINVNERLSEAEKKVRDDQKLVNDYAQLSQDIARQQLVNQQVNEQSQQLSMTKGSGALNIVPLSDAILSDKVKPEPAKTLAIAAAMGLVLGLAVACGVDWADDRVRNTLDVQAAASASVLGSIPEIAAGTSASDRAQIVHHDPFGEAAESYRTLATAIQFGLPPRTKTILITSAVSGDGKSTLVSNLGIALAQAGKRVLIVDADFRAPMQHRLFDLKDRIGLSTVLAGGERVDRAVQRTEIEGLDVLGCGPVPANPSEVLNDPAFVEYLNELADKYDLVLIDSPPVTAVADARVLAVSADVSLLVVRPAKSTRKQVTAARDGLRSVGARLVGVAVNGVGKRSGFVSASGYYPRSGALAGPARRRAPAGTTKSV
jgi:capsular exopolysaccharide synthesis family protein